MFKKWILLLLLTAANFIVIQAKAVPLVIFNYTQPGTVYLGNPPVYGPLVPNTGQDVPWSTPLTGTQPVGLLTAGSSSLCYLNGSLLMLNSALYQGDTISIIFGQPQLPSGIACACYGSACDVG